MGYRSEVTITIQNADFDRLVSEAKAQSKETLECLKYADFYRNDLFTTIYFDWVKLYEGHTLTLSKILYAKSHMNFIGLAKTIETMTIGAISMDWRARKLKNALSLFVSWI